MMRDAFTLHIDRIKQPSLFEAFAEIYRPHFRELNRVQQFNEALEQTRPVPQSVLVPPDVVIKTSEQAAAALIAAKASSVTALTYPYEHLKDHLDRCAVVFRAGKIDITPPFIPSLALDVFEQRIRRVYLSATLHNKADIVRAYGREPQIIEPNNDAGNGERLILFERNLDYGKFDAGFVARLARRHKVLVALPGYHKVPEWKGIGEPPKPENFSDELAKFRHAQAGNFILVSRVDGIDLPNDTCRLMIIDGVPRGESLLEKFQFEYLHMRNFAASRIANRLVQLFGRINRGRSDYGAFLIAGHDLNVWLNNDKHVALLPPLLKNQILLGRHVQEGLNVKTQDAVDGLLEKVLLSRPRDAGWTNYYSTYLEATDIESEKSKRAQEAERRNLAAAKAEAAYARHMWAGEYEKAREALDEVVADVARSDEKLAGWHNLWIGACLYHEQDHNEAQLYFARARGQLGSNLIVDTGPVTAHDIGRSLSLLELKIDKLTSLGRESFERQMSLIERQLRPLDGGSPAEMEEAVRALGDALGFDATRPDNEFDTGPDVLWVDVESKINLGLELKTDKQEGSSYNKADVSQSMDHLSWMRDNAAGNHVIGVTLVGPSQGVSDAANPVAEIFSTKPAILVAIRDRLLAAIRDLHRAVPAQRPQMLSNTFGNGWSLEVLAETLCAQSLKRTP